MPAAGADGHTDGQFTAAIGGAGREDAGKVALLIGQSRVEIGEDVLEQLTSRTVTQYLLRGAIQCGCLSHVLLFPLCNTFEFGAQLAKCIDNFLTLTGIAPGATHSRQLPAVFQSIK